LAVWLSKEEAPTIMDVSKHMEPDDIAITNTNVVLARETYRKAQDQLEEQLVSYTQHLQDMCAQLDGQVTQLKTRANALKS
jgi:hypothetical protein